MFGPYNYRHIHPAEPGAAKRIKMSKQVSKSSFEIKGTVINIFLILIFLIFLKYHRNKLHSLYIMFFTNKPTARRRNRGKSDERNDNHRYTAPDESTPTIQKMVPRRYIQTGSFK